MRFFGTVYIFELSITSIIQSTKIYTFKNILYPNILCLYLSDIFDGRRGQNRPDQTVEKTTAQALWKPVPVRQLSRRPVLGAK